MHILKESININSKIDTKNKENLSEITSNFQRFPNIYPLIGFDYPLFFGSNLNLICAAAGDRFLTQINLNNCVDEKIYYDLNATITALLISHDYRLIALSLNYQKYGNIIVIKDSENFKTITLFNVK